MSTQRQTMLLIGTQNSSLHGAGLALALPWFESFGSGRLQPRGTDYPKALRERIPPGRSGCSPSRKTRRGRIGAGFPMEGKRIFEFTKVLDVLEPPSKRRYGVCVALSHPAVTAGARSFQCGPVFDGGRHEGAWAIQEFDLPGSALCRAYIGEETQACLLGHVHQRRDRGTARRSDSVFQRGGPSHVPAMNKPKQIFDMLFEASGTRTRLRQHWPGAKAHWIY